MFMLGEKPIAGPLDCVYILRDVNTDKYHPCYFEERPFPGPIDDSKGFFRLKSKMHHTTGFESLSCAVANARGLADQTSLPEENLFLDPVEWNGQIALVWIVPDWRKGKE
jgi:hypothetical protein